MSEPGGAPSAPTGGPSLLHLGLDLAVAELVFLLLGWKLDSWLGTAPWLLLVGALVGMTVGFYSMWRRVRAR